MIHRNEAIKKLKVQLEELGGMCQSVTWCMEHRNNTTEIYNVNTLLKHIQGRLHEYEAVLVGTANQFIDLCTKALEHIGISQQKDELIVKLEDQLKKGVQRGEDKFENTQPNSELNIKKESKSARSVSVTLARESTREPTEVRDRPHRLPPLSTLRPHLREHTYCDSNQQDSSSESEDSASSEVTLQLSEDNDSDCSGYGHTVSSTPVLPPIRDANSQASYTNEKHKTLRKRVKKKTA